MRLGFHVSIAGGLLNAVREARLRQCQTIQIFSRNPRGWSFQPLDPAEITEFRTAIKAAGISPVVVHMPYLANVASADRQLYARSVESLAAELDRAAQLGAQYLVLHTGRTRAGDAAGARRRMQRAISRAFLIAARDLARAGSGLTLILPRLLLENTATMAEGFREIRAVIAKVRDPRQVGVALDTAHAFAAGYELRTRAGLDRMLREFDATVGLGRLLLLHLNDSKAGLGSQRDRHWHIGRGGIGREGFRNIVNHPLLRHLPGIMETPKRGLQDDLRNLRAVSSLVADRLCV